MELDPEFALRVQDPIQGHPFFKTSPDEVTLRVP
jgi:hypothetical protein